MEKSLDIVTPVIVAIESTLISLSNCIIWPRDYISVRSITEDILKLAKKAYYIEDLHSIRGFMSLIIFL